MDEEIKQLNNVIKKNSKTVFSLLSKKGKDINFPKKGILYQSQEAKEAKYNATVGMALFDDKSPMRLKAIESKINLEPKRVFPYAPSYGNMELREAWKKLLFEKNPSIKGEISTPVVSLALTGGLFDIAYLFVNKGDKIIMPQLYWENYHFIFEKFFDGKIATYDIFTKDGKFNLMALKKNIEKVTKPIILFNFPNNPTGYTVTEKEAEEIKELLLKFSKKKQILVICDDAYFGLVYEDGISKESLFSKFHNLSENLLCVKLDAATKEDYVWGLRVGFITYGVKNGTIDLYKSLEDKTAGVIRGSISSASNLSQSLVYDLINSKDYKEEKMKNFLILKERYDEVKKVLSDKKYGKYFYPYPYNSGYFMCVKLNKGINLEEVRKTLISKYSTGIIVLNDIIRVAYSSLKKEDVKILFDNIYSACEDVVKSKR